jgi:hypothetical protein
LGAAWILATSTVSAQQSAEDRETARSLMQEARDLRERGELKAALERFRAADGIMRVPTTAFEVARTQVALGLLIEARETIAAIRKRPAKPTDPPPFAEARNKAEDLDVSLAQRVPSVVIAVEGVPAGAATVRVDGEQIAAAAIGLPRKLNPGHHVVSARTADAEGSQEIDIAEKETKEVRLTLAATSPPAATAESAAVPAATLLEREPLTTPRSHSPTLITWIAAGVGGAGLLAGGITGLVSMSKTSSLSKECPMKQCMTSSAKSDFNSAQTLATVSNVGFIVGGVGAAFAVGSLVIGRSAPAGAAAASSPTQESPGGHQGLRVTPWVGLAEAGLRGSF